MQFQGFSIDFQGLFGDPRPRKHDFLCVWGGVRGFSDAVQVHKLTCQKAETLENRIADDLAQGRLFSAQQGLAQLQRHGKRDLNNLNPIAYRK